VGAWLARVGRVAVGWAVTLTQPLRGATRADEGAPPAGRCALVCGPFLRGAPILGGDERAELRRFVEAQLPER
jgi:hypothetical protein